jgi:DNA polymerase III delta prime subunit
MAFPICPEVLAADWLPPVLLGREPLRRAAGTALLAALEAEARPPPLLVEGPPGAGTSSFARAVAHDLAEEYRRRGGPAGRVVAVRVRWCPGTTGVASALLREFDEGFRGQGFSVAEILAGFLRRAQRDGRPLLIVLDDVSPGAPDLIPLLRAFRAPERFLPEGVERGVPLHVVLAGPPSAEALRRGWEAEGGRFLGPFRLPAFSPVELRALALDRAQRALGAPPREELLGRVVHTALTEGRGAARVLEILRAELLPPAVEPILSVAGVREIPPLLFLEPRIAEAIAGACASGPASLTALRAWDARLARAAGERPFAPTTLWRRLVRLEQAGIVRRELRAGGPGGSHSTIRLLRPAAHLRRLSRPTGTLPTFAGARGTARPPAARSGRWTGEPPAGPARAPGPRPPGT